MGDAFKQHPPPEHTVLLLDLLTWLPVAFAFGCAAAAMHHFTSGRRGRRVDRSFLATLVMLSVLIALVTMVIGSNVARAFSLVGALAIIRFRTVVADTRDTAFVIYAVVAGMAVGSGNLVGPLVCTPLILLAAWIFRVRRNEPKPGKGTLVVRLGAGRPPDDRVQALLQQYLPTCRLTGLSTARGGTALDASYAIMLPPPEKVFALVNELGRLEGVQSVELEED
jgi:hypothetical protein